MPDYYQVRRWFTTVCNNYLVIIIPLYIVFFIIIILVLLLLHINWDKFGVRICKVYFVIGLVLGGNV